MRAATDWEAWHAAYADEESALSRRLKVVRDLISAALPPRPREPVKLVSLCAGRGGDAIEVLREYEHARQVRARLVELDPRNVAAMADSQYTTEDDDVRRNDSVPVPRQVRGITLDDLQIEAARSRGF